MLLQDEFAALADAEGPALISIYLPTARFGPEVAQGPIRLKRLLAEVRERVGEGGVGGGDGGGGAAAASGGGAGAGAGWPSPAELERWLAPLARHLEDDIYWNHQAEGLALFVGPEGVTEHQLPFAVDELVYVGPHFNLRPLLPAVSRGRAFYVLALSQKHVRLFEASIAGIREVSLDGTDVPGRLEDAVGWDWSDESLQFRSGAGARGVGGRGGAGGNGGGGAGAGGGVGGGVGAGVGAGGAAGGAMFHGHGDVGDRKDEIRRFLMAVDRGLAGVVEDRSAPMVVAAVDYLVPMLAQVSKLGNELLSLPGNPDRLSDAELHEAALEVVWPVLQAADDVKLQRLADTAHTDRAAVGLKDVIRTGVEARHGTLLIDASALRWGRLTNPGGELELHEEREAGSADLLDEAWRIARAVGAEIVPVAGGALPDGAEVAALLRH